MNNNITAPVETAMQTETSEKMQKVSVAARTKNDTQALENVRDTFLLIADAINDVLTGMSFMEACRKRNLDYLKIRRIFTLKTLENCRTDGIYLKLSDIIIEPDGYEKLYMEAFKLDDMSKIEFPPDFRQTVLDILSAFNERERDIIQMRYGIGDYEQEYTLAEIGKKYNLTRERISEIEKKVLRKISHPSSLKWLQMGSLQYNAEQQIKKEAETAKKKSMNKWLEEERKKMQETPEDCLDYSKIDASCISLDDMELSVRSCNCLRRAGKKNLMDIIQMSDDDFRQVRNLGIRNVEEICKRRDELIRELIAKQNPGVG